MHTGVQYRQDAHRCIEISFATQVHETAGFMIFISYVSGLVLKFQ